MTAARSLFYRRGAVIAAAIASIIIMIDLMAPPPLHKAGNLSPIVVDKDGRWLHAFAAAEGRWRFRASLDEIDPAYLERLLAIEDKRFYRHWGVDPLAVLRAGIASIRAGRVVSGASTITMQTARLLEPRPRTLPSKFVEIIRALQIERRLSKQEILSLYLTLAPYGGNIEGVRAASLIYFDKEPTRLTDAEQALLIALPQAPEARRPDRRAANAKEARATILQKLVSLGALSEARAAEAASAPLPSMRRAFPRLAYHAAHRLAADASDDVVATTLSAGLQAQAEALVKTHAAGFDDGATASLIIVENDTRAVRAAVGSSGFDVEGGWIDLTTALRSPGSALKPFIYGLAMEDGLISSSTIIADMPRAFGDYTPENFDRTYRGAIRVREALQHSLNVPAVSVLQKIGVARFASALKAGGVHLHTPATADRKQGLALALGGAGVTAQDLAALYAALGDDGVVKPLRWRKSAPLAGDASYALFSTETARRISAILADAPSLEGRAPAALSQRATRVAYKTGTSYGYRDAWAAGHGGSYTIVAWVGHADGRARPGWTGRKAAAPLLFDAFDMLEQNGEAMPETIDQQALPQIDGALARLERPAAQNPPQIIFPRSDVEVFLDGAARGFALAARGGAQGYRWYVDGAPLLRDELSDRAIWRPSQEGFYDITVVDGDGRSARSKVRVRR